MGAGGSVAARYGVVAVSHIHPSVLGLRVAYREERKPFGVEVERLCYLRIEIVELREPRILIPVCKLVLRHTGFLGR